MTKRKANSRPGRKTTQGGQCRIIAGKWRGRIIRFEDAEGLRPTTDRIRETVFNWLQAYVPQSYCLDCFAGSGVLGFEALSRGASEVVFIEQNKITVNNLIDNSRQLEADKAIIIHQNALLWLQAMSSDGGLNGCHAGPLRNKFDLVFLDPPFDSNLLETSSAWLHNSACLAEGAVIYVEHAVNSKVVLPASWLCLKEKHSGQVSYKLYQNRT